MPRTGAALPSLLALLASACAWGTVEGPELLAVTPAELPNHLGAPVLITGRAFEPEVVADFDEPGRSTVDARFSVTLVNGETRLPLAGVERVSSTELGATFAAGTPPGTYDVEVRDPRGRRARLAAALRVYDVVEVTTAVDEADPDASPETPGGAGFSLREAMEWVNARGTATHIQLSGPLTISMTPPQTAMTLTAPGAAVIGSGGVVLDFGGINQSCFTLAGPGQRLAGVTLRGCTGTFVAMAPDSGGSQVTEVDFDVVGTAYWAYGILAQSTSMTPSRIGPGNHLSRLWIALKIDGSAYEVVGNTVRDNSTGIRLAGFPAWLWQNTFTAQVAGGSNKGIGVSVLTGPGPLEILHNVFDGNAVDGLQAAAVGSLTVRNNLFTSNGGVGINAQPGGLVHDHNGFFANGAGPVAAGLATGPTDLLADPLYADPADGDFWLLPSSPAIDAGLDTGLDVNGAAPGRYDGLAPDLGAFESP